MKMRYQSLVLASLAACVCASPANIIAKRDEETWDENGNLKLTFSKQTVTLGTIEIDEIFGELGNVCHESGQCETNDVSMDGQLLSSDSAVNIELVLGPDGSYPTWIRNGLLDGLKAAVQEMAKCEETHYSNSCPNPMVYCPDNSKTVTQCEVPQFWGINFQAEGEENAAPPNLGVDLEVKPADSSVCEDTITALSGVAAAVNGAAGGIFVLLSFACT